MSNPNVLILEEELAVHEATLQTLLRRQQELVAVEQAQVQRQGHVERLDALCARRDSLLEARPRHEHLQHELQQALEKSQERLARVLSSSAVDTVPLEQMKEEPTLPMDSHVTENELEQEGDTAPAISVPNLQVQEEIMTAFLETNHASSSQRLEVLFPCLNSIDLMQRIMNLTALETLALDQTNPQGTHRQEALWNTCLDLFATASTTSGTSESTSVVQAPNNELEETTETDTAPMSSSIDPNVALCPYELSGECADPYCPYQHMVPRTTGKTAVLARERLALPTLKLPSLGVTTSSGGAATVLQPQQDTTPPASPLRKRQRVETEHDDDESLQTLADENSVHTQISPPEQEESQEEDKSDDPEKQEESMDWNDDFLSLPPASQPVEEEEDSDDSDSDKKDAENVTNDQEVIDEKHQGEELSFWWQTEEDVARIKERLPLQQLSLADWLRVMGGFLLDKKMDENGLVSTVLKYQGTFPPSPPVQVIAFLGRIVDCVRLCLHAGRFEITHSLCDYAQETLHKVLADMNAQEDSNEHDALVTALRTSVDILKNARDSAFCFNSANVTTFQCAFQAEVSMAMLNSSLRLLYTRVSSDDDSGEPMDAVFTMLSFVATRLDPSSKSNDARPIPFPSEQLSEEWKFLCKIKPDGEVIKEEWQDPSFHLDFVASKVLQRGQRIIEVLSQCPLEAFAEDVLKPVLSELREYSKKQTEHGSSNDCLPVLYIQGYIILGCVESVCSQIVRRGDQSLDTSSTLTAIDSCIYQIVTCLTNIASTEPLAELCLAPLNALSVAMAATLRRYGKAQRRLEAALNAALAKKRSALCGGYLVYSELLWSQMIQLRSSLPLLPESSESKRLVSLPSDMKSQHRTIAATAHAFGVQPNHVTLCGDWNMIKAFDLDNQKYAALAHVRKYTFSLFESLFATQRQHAGNSLFCNLWHLPLTEASMAKRTPSSPSLAFPRSTLLVGRELSVIMTNNCYLKQLPVTFGKFLPNLKVLKLAENSLTELPYSIGKLRCLTDLDVSSNRLSSLPPTIGSLKNLTRLNASHNELSSVPSTVIKCKSLEELLLSDNPLGAKDIPNGMTLRCPNLYKIDVDNANHKDEEEEDD